MLSKQHLKLIKSLAQKKIRHQKQLFVVEGEKAVLEFLNSDYELERLFVTKGSFPVNESQTVYITPKELQKISFLKSPNVVLAIFKIPQAKALQGKGLTVILDAVRDPGNLGTIIRLCDWFGVSELVCSPTTVDVYNPKVIQATMGSLTRVNVHYKEVLEVLASSDRPILGTFMEGDNIYTSNLPQNGMIVLGNEANGISKAVSERVGQAISIPQFGSLGKTESLNVANAAAVVLSEFRRRTIEM